MSIIIASAIATGPSQKFTMTAGTNGNNNGYIAGSIGSLSPTSINGQTIDWMNDDGLLGGFTLRLDGTLSQDFFYSIDFTKATNLLGSGQLFYSSDASFSTAAGKSTWEYVLITDLPTSGTVDNIYMFYF